MKTLGIQCASSALASAAANGEQIRRTSPTPKPTQLHPPSPDLLFVRTQVGRSAGVAAPSRFFSSHEQEQPSLPAGELLTLDSFTRTGGDAVTVWGFLKRV